MIFITGNHDLDFLSLDWEYKSLQKNLIYCFLTDSLAIKYRELKESLQNLDYICYKKINQKLLRSKIQEKLLLLNTFYDFVISKNIYVHGGIPKFLLQNLSSQKELNINNFIKILKNTPKLISKNGSNSMLTCDQSPDLPTENLIEISELLNKLNLRNLLVGHNPFLGINFKGKTSNKLDIYEAKNQKYIFNIQKIGQIIKLDTGVKFGNNKPKIYTENYNL